MDEIEINTMQIGDRRRWRNNSIERITCLQHHRVAWINTHRRWNIRMPAIVSRAGLLAETFASINVDCLGSHSNVLSLESVLGENTRRVSGCQHATLRDRAGAERLSTPAARWD